MNNRRFLYVVVLALLLSIVSVFLWAARPTAAQSGQQTTTVVMTHPSQGDVVEIVGSSATLITTNDGASMTLSTSGLEPGNVHTVWWVVINQPENCATSPCSGSDVLAETDVVKADVTYAGGQIVGDTGEAVFSWDLATGDLPNSWYTNGFTNPLGAEIQIVLNDHGPPIADMVDNMLGTYRGGCTDESLPPPFPETAKADGQPGPNTCRLVQRAIFQQQAPATLPASGGSNVNNSYSLTGWLLLLVGGFIVAIGRLAQRKVSRLS